MIVIKLGVVRLVEPLDVAAEQEQVVYAQEVQVDQAILRLILGEALADEVWHGCDAVAVLYGRGDGD